MRLPRDNRRTNCTVTVDETRTKIADYPVVVILLTHRKETFTREQKDTICVKNVKLYVTFRHVIVTKMFCGSINNNKDKKSGKINDGTCTTERRFPYVTQ